MRKPRKPRKKTKRERLMLSENKRRRHEMRKRRKTGDQSPVYLNKFGEECWAPNLEAMFKPKKVKS
jgi:hypothetical protein